ncbi:hypothetical protein AVEN_126297-1 [Araneus ventricosus]|uniref:Uncharacterized protein n=1 Tax=Araneus ventricosus TaxID=182803 RepID=A0A4Y2I2K7_ARAVE|nr:hypothetical protein AVEN_126297-1 [Araneus ventricosus]
MCLSGADSNSDKEAADMGCGHQQMKLSAQQTLGKIDESARRKKVKAKMPILRQLQMKLLRDLFSQLKKNTEKLPPEKLDPSKRKS